MSALAVATLLGLPLAARALIPSGGCVNEVSGMSNNCTANDVTFVVVGLGTETDGCVSTTDTVNIFLQGQVRNTTAQTRYDVGLYVAVDGDLNGDGALTGTCARDILSPVGTVGVTTCGSTSLDLLRQFPTGSPDNGPYLNVDGDGCGDLFSEGNTGCDQNGDGLWDDSIIRFSQALTFPCDEALDTNGAGTGFVKIPTCATWGNQDNQVDTTGDGQCNSDAEAVPGTKSKCRCEDVTSTIPLPKLDLTCSCVANTLRPGSFVTCSVGYNNTATCVPDPATPERFRCGTASYVRFNLDDGISNASADNGSFSVVSASSGTTSGTPNGILWTPASSVGTLGVIGPSSGGSLSFQYTVSPTAPNGPISLTTSTQWADDPSFSSFVTQTLSTTCNLTVDATWAAVSSFTAYPEDGRVVAEWETASEVGSAGFDLERLDPASGRWVRVNDHLLPALDVAPGGTYRFADEGAPGSGRVTYRLTEIDSRGSRRVLGPFPVDLDRAPRPQVDIALPAGFSAQPKAPSERVLHARETRAAGTRGTSTARAKSLKGNADSPTAVEVGVTADGLYRLSAAEIAAASGETASQAGARIRRGEVRLTRAGQEVAWTADDGPSILFYGEAPTGNFARQNVYLLDDARGAVIRRSGGSAPAPAGSDLTFRDTVHAEQDLLVRPEIASDPQEDYWYWGGVIAGVPGRDRASFPVELDGVTAAAAAPAALRVRLVGFSSDPSGFRASLAVNGTSVGQVAWSGHRPEVASLTVPAAVLHDGTNTVELAGADGIILLDDYDLTYDRLYRAVGDRLTFRGGDNPTVSVGGFSGSDVTVYDLADPLHPEAVGAALVDLGPDGRYRVSLRPASPSTPYLAVGGPGILAASSLTSDTPSDLHNPANRASYLVIAPHALLPGAHALADDRGAAGYETMVVDVADIMDEWNGGVFDPEAIRSFLTYAHTHWELPPRYVVLVGKGSFDYLDRLGFGSDLLPPIMVPTSNGLVASDNRYADVDGDGVPEAAIGRIPALTNSDVTAYLAKIDAYEAGNGDWTGRVVLVADDPDTAGDFPDDSDALATLLPPGLDVARVYLGRPYSADQARSQLLDDIDSGAALVNYIGHGGLDRFASEGILRTEDLSQLGNGDRLPVVTALTCNIGYFAFPGNTSLGEELVLRASGGAAAVWGPAGLSINSQAILLGGKALPALLATPRPVLGDAVLGALRAYAAAGGDRELLGVYNLLGDPALELR